MRPWWSRRDPPLPLDRVADLLATFQLLELAKGVMLSGRYVFARRIAVRYPEPGAAGARER